MVRLKELRVEGEMGAVVSAGARWEGAQGATVRGVVLLLVSLRL